MGDLPRADNSLSEYGIAESLHSRGARSVGQGWGTCLALRAPFAQYE